MKRTKASWAGILWGALGVWAACSTAWAQAWQESPSNSASARGPWQQRVLKQPQQSQWHAASRPADSAGQTTRLAQATEPYQPPARPYPTTSSYRTARRAANEGDVFDNGTVPKEPGATTRQPAPAASSPEVIPRGQVQFEPMATHGEFAAPGGCAACGEPGLPCGECGECDPCCGTPCGECCNFGWEVFDGRCAPLFRGISIFAGVDGFKSDGAAQGDIPLANRLPNKNGTFGINEGLNMARPLGDPWGCGYQIGANFVQSDFAGRSSTTDGDGTPFAPYRRQYFVTAGLFRRAVPGCGGLQGGVAYDYLHDVYNPYGSDNYTQTSLQQIRSETSFVCDDCWEIGYYGAYGLSTDMKHLTLRNVAGTLKVNPTSMYALFVRRNFENGGDGRLWAGLTGNGDGLLGVDLWVPLGQSIALENRVNYMIPKQGSGTDAQQRESWGLVVQLVWYPGLNAKCQHSNPYRPIFNVADNSLFMVDRLFHQTSPSAQ